MAAVLRKFLPVSTPSPKRGRDYDDGDDNGNSFRIDYSFAMEYQGPPISNVPQAVPVEIDRIPIAQPVSFSSQLNDVQVPVIQPIVKTKRVSYRPSKGDEFGRGHSGLGGDSEPGSSVVLKGRHVVSGSSSSCSSTSSMRLDLLGSASIDVGDQNISDDSKSSCGLPSLSSSGRVDLSGSVSEGESDERPPDDKKSLGDLRALEELNDVARLSGSFKRTRSLDNYDEERRSRDDGDSISSKNLSGEQHGQAVNSGPGSRPSVTFIEPHVSSATDEVYDISDTESLPAIPKAERRGKKGSCYRCLKGNRFTEKEICLVCHAKYCFNCVRRAMGAMPEGRKCVPCIGRRIDESKRGSLGKCSRMLRRLITDLEVKQIMNAEISCKTNQLSSRLIVVNCQPLSEEELYRLQTCPNPPKKLKPGRYWYDKVAGYWGKEGDKPCQIISPHMNIGGTIKRDASNGDTEILINYREITSLELWMLKRAGVQCEGKPHFWVNADGSYQEEGQNHVKGYIWDKKRARLACTIVSLPIPPVHSVVESVSLPCEGKLLHKLLLIGNANCGTSTIYKQARFLYDVPFTEDERKKIKFTIQVNLYSYLATVLEAHERFEEQMVEESSKNHSAEQNGQTSAKIVSSITPRLKHFSNWLIKEKEEGNLDIFPASSRENAQTVAALWRDPGIQSTYKRIRDTLPRNAIYFLERILEISKQDYDPLDRDILHAEGLTSSVGLSCVEFSFTETSHESSLDPDYQHDPKTRYQLIRLKPRSLGDNCKWLDMFEDADMVIFCVSLTDYDEYIEDGHGILVNKMMTHKQLFESLVTHPCLAEKKFLLFLTKFDLLEHKIEHVPLTTCEWFQDFNPLISQNQSSRNNPPMAQRAFHYIAFQFKRLYDSLVSPFSGHRRNYQPKLFVSQTNLESETVDDALRYAREILKWHMEETCMFQEISTTSLEASLSS